MPNDFHRWEETTVAVSTGTSVSATFTLQPWTTFIGAFFPAMDDGDIGLEYSRDGGSTYAPILDATDGEDYLVVASGGDPGYVDMSDMLRSIPRGRDDSVLRFTCAAQTPAVDIVVNEGN